MYDDLYWFLDGAIINDPATGRAFLNMKPDEFEKRLRKIIERDEAENWNTQGLAFLPASDEDK